ncbi:50S ribosomal protein L11 methyltransferase [Paludifilum halophilum]|uniref:Ribosomal protein L11 methyltransferase n=1 Tax=Paludifilum halophilum TaxID=1642702 RepID=A0A235B5S2_9BACL|nr:50S ribosomal protein L11 methyltransferase [Paludifilum halophilum]OYD07654.1 50S ribosomal protein L11 methyltransferase [Paludifilum halophilum]
MNWIEIRVHTSSEAEEAVSFLLRESGATGVAVADSAVLNRDFKTPYGEIISLSEAEFPSEGVWISGYIPESSFSQSSVDHIRKATAELGNYGLDPGPAEVRVRKVSEESWSRAWKAYYKPVRISEKLTVKPRWEPYQPVGAGERVIELDPGMAFGTGTHPTTRLSMKLMERWMPSEGRVIDVGCGSGILAIAAAKLGAKGVLAVDLDPVAVDHAAENVRMNGVETQVHVRRGDLLQEVETPCDLVVSNILAEIILRLTGDLPRVLKPGGIFIASGIISDKESLVEKALVEMGWDVMERIQEKDWVALAIRA